MILVQNEVVTASKFPAGESHILFSPLLLSKLKDELKKVGGTINVTWKYREDSELFQLLSVLYKVKDLIPCQNPTNINLYIPYCPHARMDRIKEDSQICTSKVFASILARAKDDDLFDTLIVDDIHSNDSMDYLLNGLGSSSVINQTKSNLLVDQLIFLRKLDLSNVTLIFPDQGAYDRYNHHFEHLKGKIAGILNCKKVREFGSGQINSLVLDLGEDKSYQLIDMEGSTAIIVDDICSYGGTFEKVISATESIGFKEYYLAVTHLEQAYYIGSLAKSDKLKGVITTNSFDYNHHKGSIHYVNNSELF